MANGKAARRKSILELRTGRLVSQGLICIKLQILALQDLKSSVQFSAFQLQAEAGRIRFYSKIFLI